MLREYRSPRVGDIVAGGRRLETTLIFPSTNTARTGPDGRFSMTILAGDTCLPTRRGGDDQPAQETRQMIDVAGIDIDASPSVGSGGTLRGLVTSDDAHRCRASIVDRAGAP